MSFFKKNKICVTHNGSFHADDLFATAALFILNDGNIKIIRTRDQEIINKGDYVYDVGGKYDPESNFFDHHQKEGAGLRDNGIPYASFGLIWKHFGLSICNQDFEVWKSIDDKIVAPIDAGDNGVDVITLKFKDVIPYGLSQTFLVYSPTWEEDESKIDYIFEDQVKKVATLLKREIEVASSDAKARKIILRAYENSPDKRLIILESSFPRYLYRTVLSELSEPVFAIFPGSGDYWKVEAISKAPNTMESRKLFPVTWRGLSNEDSQLKDITGISDIIFCHRSGFLINTKTKEGALRLAQKALIA